MTSLDARPHTLYRLLDRHGRLLYVGISSNIKNRMAAHALDKTWWHTVRDTVVENHPDRRSALNAERAAIETEAPLHNRRMNGSARPAAPLPLPAGAVVALGLHDGTCPVGEVAEVDDIGLVLHLYRWMPGDFWGPTEEYRWHQVADWLSATYMPPSQRRRHLGADDAHTGPCLDMDPLADYQTAWKPRRVAA